MRTFLTMLLLTVVLLVSAQSIPRSGTYELRALKSTLILKEASYESDAPVRATINFRTQQCVIETENTQIIDYVLMRYYTDSDGYLVMETAATDTNYRNIDFKMAIHPDNKYIIITIEYADRAYLYGFVVLNN